MLRLCSPQGLGSRRPVEGRRPAGGPLPLIGNQINGQVLAELDTDGLSPRMEQTVRWLLGGDSEKQVAAKLRLSQHTVHVYVKALYRKYKVSSRGELLAKWVKKN